MERLDSTDEIFEVLYNLAVGFERLLKIQIALMEINQETNLDEFEESLITHSHLELVARINKIKPLNFSTPHNDLLQILSKFYKSHRYNRFQLSSIKDSTPETSALISFFVKHLKLKFPETPDFFYLPNTWREKRFLGKIVGKIVNSLYEAVYISARAKNLYTYEINHGTKAYKIFLMKDFNFFKEEILAKEILIFLSNTKETSGCLSYIKNLECLGFDPELTADYVSALSCDKKKLWCMDELESIYEDLDNKCDRLKMLELIGNTDVHIEENNEDEA